MSPNTVECGGCHKKFRSIRDAIDHQYAAHPAKDDGPRQKARPTKEAEVEEAIEALDRVDEINAGLEWDDSLD